MAKKKNNNMQQTNITAWVLIILGLIFFAQNRIDVDINTLWPILLIALGIKLLAK